MNRRAFIKRAALAAAATALPGRALRSEITHYADFTNYPDVAVVSDDALVEAFWPMPVIPARVWAELAAMQSEQNRITSAIFDIERIAPHGRRFEHGSL